MRLLRCLWIFSVISVVVRLDVIWLLMVMVGWLLFKGREMLGMVWG